MKIPENTLTKDILIIQTYFFEIIEDLILNGFIYNNERYVCFTASAGQIRTKKTVFIKESVLKNHFNTITCGLSLDKINKHGGVNINKYLAYLALCNSATDLWKEFDIRKSIVVPDFETNVKGIVDLIDDKTYTIDEKKEMNIPIPHTDGCGMILPKKSKKNMMVRLPWVKGLLISFPFDRFIREYSKKSEKNCGLVKDIYGVEHDILEEGIEVIFTESQFKMHKYYDGWEQYVNNYIKHKCQAGKCNEEEDSFRYAKMNYKMIQTLTDMTASELKKISKITKKDIINIGKDRKTMLKVLGVTKSNTNKNYIQQALEIYPELLNDTYCKEILKAVKKSLTKEARAGKLDINGKYTFISPDLYAFCERLFLGIENPRALLGEGEVYCKLFKDYTELDCLRSPHLYKEHAIRKNVIDNEKARWFTTNAVYTSCHDIISKILMFDVDGDKSLVCADETIIKVAKRNMEGIVPLYYNMAKAGAEHINNESIYNGLKTAYTGGNIGMISNDITKIWNSSNVNIDVIKLLCMENNFTIDYAKTLYKPERPKDKKNMITDYTKSKTPHFFIYAKDKQKDKVEPINNSVVNRLDKIIPSVKINFKATNLGKFDYRMLMKNKNVELNQEIINEYTKLDLRHHFMVNKTDEGETSNIVYLYNEIRNKLLELNKDTYYVTDVLVKYLYNHKKSNYKTTLWECFGDVVIENLKNNVEKKIGDDTILCEICGERIEVEGKAYSKKYCNECFQKQRRIYKTEKQREYRQRVDRAKNL